MGRDGSETERLRTIYDRDAAGFDRKIGLFERLLFKGGREWVASQAKGDVLEIAIGTGRNLAFYPSDVKLTGIELSDEMLDRARARTQQLGRAAILQQGDAQALAFNDATFDTVVCTLSLCAIPDDRAAIAEAKRVLRPAGVFLLLEHVGSTNRVVRAGQRLLEPLSLRFEGDHLVREPVEHLRAAGFQIEHVERLKAGIVARIRARKPGN